MKIILTNPEREILFQQDPSTSNDGGFQSLLISFQRRINKTTNAIDLTLTDLDRIPRYAFDYGNGGWEERLKNIFARTLGSHLGHI